MPIIPETPTSIQMPWAPGDPTTPHGYLVAYMASRRFSQDDMATMLAVTRQSVSRWVNHRVPFGAVWLTQLRLHARFYEAEHAITPQRFPELYEFIKRNRWARGQGSASQFSRVDQRPQHPGYAERRSATIAELFAGKPDITIELEGEE